MRMQDRAGPERVNGRQSLVEEVTPGYGEPTPAPVPTVIPHRTYPPQMGAFYEGVLLDTLRGIWRRRLLIASCVAVGLGLAVLAISFTAPRYTANAVIQLNFDRAPAPAGPPGATMDAGILVEGEARLVRSPAFARRVAERLNLAENPDYTSPGFIARFVSHIRTGPGDTSQSAKVDLAARKLSKQIVVTNDTRSYQIGISVVSDSPEWSAKLANAFAIEYLGHPIIQRLEEAEATARAALQEARTTYGEKHPKILQALAQLEAAEARTREEEKLRVEQPDQMMHLASHTFLRAEPVWLPSGPNPVVFLGVGLVASLLAGVAVALLLERSDTSFRTELSVPAETGIPCVAMFPKKADWGSSDRTLEQREALRSLCLTTGLSGQIAGPRVVMISSALPDERRSTLVKELADWLVEDDKRVLIIDTSPSCQNGSEISLDDVMRSPALMQKFATEQNDQPVSVLCRQAGLNGARNPFTALSAATRGIGQILTVAKRHYDVVIIDTPPALLFSESVLLGRFADVTLLVAIWRKTPRIPVANAVNRLQENMVRVDGIVLADVDLNRYPSFGRSDRTFYVQKHHHLFSQNG